MNRLKIPALLCALLLCLSLAGCQLIHAETPPNSAGASGVQATPAISKVSESFAAAQPIYDRLIVIVDENAADEESDPEEEPDLDEAEAAIKELNDMVGTLNGLISDLVGLPDGTDTSEGKTVLAAREYLGMLRDMAGDIAELEQYALDFYKALLPMMEQDDVDDFKDFAEQLFYAIDDAQALLAQITPPTYIANSHADVVKRLDEFQDFSEDFWLAAALEDPLRTYSCMYRMNRITIMFDRCDENLQKDLDLQTTQAERRMKGPIAKLHDELARNLSLLGAS